MNEYYSFKFSKLYLNTDIPGSCKLYMFQLTEASMLMFTAMKECVDLIHNNGGFTAVGWYKRGVINENSIIAARKINCAGSKGG